MTFTSNLKTLRYGDSSLKLMYAISATGACEDNVDEVLIENLVMVGLRWKASICDDKGVKIEFYYSLNKGTDDYRIVKTNISSDELKYFKTGIHTPEEWSDWEPMGHIITTLKRAAVNKTGTTWIAVVDLCITAYEVKIIVDTVSSKLYADTDLTDFYISATDGKVAVHKAYLGAHSDVFKAMLKREWKETVEGQINLQGVTVHTLQHLKDYMYLGTVPDYGLRPLLLLARCYLIEDLEKQCIRKLAERILPEDLFSLLDFACVNNIPELTYEMLQITRDSTVNKARQIKEEAALEKQCDTKGHQ